MTGKGGSYILNFHEMLTPPLFFKKQGVAQNVVGRQGVERGSIWRTIMQFDSKLIPIMREGVTVIKMIFFKRLMGYLFQKYPDREVSDIKKLSGAILNELFGTPNPEEPFAAFAEENKSCIKEEMKHIATELKEMRIPLTDALRVQFLCDHEEGRDSASILSHAQKLGVLLVDREIPLPAHFMNLVRKLGCAFDILANQTGAKQISS